MNKSDEVIVLADGCFDPLHFGHVRYLRTAGMLGRLVVNVAPDAAIEAKGRKPFQSLVERINTVAHINGVDEVCSEDLAKAIHYSKPAYLVKGVEWVGQLPADVIEACRRAHTTVIYTDTREKSSTERLA